jgi:hypothetical protein
MTKHRWHDEIVAWAGGAEIEFTRTIELGWDDTANPEWNENYFYRIKPQPKQPKYLYVYVEGFGAKVSHIFENNSAYIGKIEVQDD